MRWKYDKLNLLEYHLHLQGDEIKLANKFGYPGSLVIQPAWGKIKSLYYAYKEVEQRLPYHLVKCSIIFAILCVRRISRKLNFLTAS